MAEETPFIFLRLNILRESLERELVMTGLPFPYDFEVNMIDTADICEIRIYNFGTSLSYLTCFCCACLNTKCDIKVWFSVSPLIHHSVHLSAFRSISG